MNKMNCTECGKPATFMVWGCCEYYQYPMCDEHANIAQWEDWGRATDSCDPTDVEYMSEWLARSSI